MGLSYDTPKSKPSYVPATQYEVVQPLPALSIAADLVSLIVTAESVVVTATIVVDDSHHKLSVRWGDGTSDVINLGLFRSHSIQFGDAGNSPNTVRVQHVYQSPFDVGSRLVTVVATDTSGETTSESAVVDLERRYSVTFFSVVLEFPHHLDSAFETESEMEALMYAKYEGEEIFKRSWKESVVTAPNIITGTPITWALEGSGFQRELSESDEPIKIWFELAENDGPGTEDSLINKIWDVITSPVILFKMSPYSTNPGLDNYDPDDFKNLFYEMPLTLHPLTAINRTVSTGIYRLPLDRGVVFVRFNYELRLLIPIDQGGRQLMTTT